MCLSLYRHVYISLSFLSLSFSLSLSLSLFISFSVPLLLSSSLTLFMYMFLPLSFSVFSVSLSLRDSQFHLFLFPFPSSPVVGEKLNPFMANKLMTAALRLEMPDLAIDIFEDAFGFYYDPDPAKGKYYFPKCTCHL